MNSRVAGRREAVRTLNPGYFALAAWLATLGAMLHHLARTLVRVRDT